MPHPRLPNFRARTYDKSPLQEGKSKPSAMKRCKIGISALSKYLKFGRGSCLETEYLCPRNTSPKGANKGEKSKKRRSMDRIIKFVVRGCAVATLMALSVDPSQGQHIGDVWCSDGKYRSPEEYTKAAKGINAKGIVFWVSPTGENGGNRMVALKDTKKMEKDQGGTIVGLGFSRKDNAYDDLPPEMEIAYDAEEAPGTNQYGVHGILCSEWRGKANSDHLRDLNAKTPPIEPKGPEDYLYPCVASISKDEYKDGWYVPSMPELLMLAAQYRLVAEGLENVIAKEGKEKAELMCYLMYYSSSIENEYKGAYYLGLSGGIKSDGQYDRGYSTNMGVRAIRAF